MTNYRPDSLTLANWRLQPQSKWSFQHVMEVLPTSPVKAAAPSTAAQTDGMNAATGLFDGLFFTERKLKLETLLEQTESDAFSVWHRGKPVWAWNAPHMDTSNTHLLFSVSKSITAVLAGILADRGLLDCSAPVSRYLDVPAASGYADCTVQHVLDMTVALAFVEDYTADADDYIRYRIATGWNPVDQTRHVVGLREFVLSLGKADREHGSQFSYLSPNSDLLGLIVTSAAGKPFGDLMSELLWVPMGAQTDACIAVDYYGDARTAGGICTTISDLARLGQLICDNGVSQSGQQVLPTRWISEMTLCGDQTAWLKGSFAENMPVANYKNMWYQFGDADNSICAIGIHGQYLYINPARKVVITRLASQALPQDEAFDADVFSALQLITSQFS